MKITTRPATAGDVLAFFGKKAPQTIRAHVMERDGEVLGIGGYYLAGGTVVVFSDLKDGVPKLRVWREALAMMDRLKFPAICMATENSGRFLRRLGWQYVGPSDEGDVYQWQR